MKRASGIFRQLPVNDWGTAERQCTDKKWYEDRKGARKAAKRMAAREGRPYATYRCQVCDGYHVTSIRARPAPAGPRYPVFEGGRLLCVTRDAGLAHRLQTAVDLLRRPVAEPAPIYGPCQSRESALQALRRIAGASGRRWDEVRAGHYSAFVPPLVILYDDPSGCAWLCAVDSAGRLAALEAAATWEVRGDDDG